MARPPFARGAAIVLSTPFVDRRFDKETVWLNRRIFANGVAERCRAQVASSGIRSKRMLGRITAFSKGRMLVSRREPTLRSKILEVRSCGTAYNFEGESPRFGVADVFELPATPDSGVPVQLNVLVLGDSSVQRCGGDSRLRFFGLVTYG